MGQPVAACGAIGPLVVLVAVVPAAVAPGRAGGPHPPAAVPLHGPGGVAGGSRRSGTVPLVAGRAGGFIAPAEVVGGVGQELPAAVRRRRMAAVERRLSRVSPAHAGLVDARLLGHRPVRAGPLVGEGLAARGPVAPPPVRVRDDVELGVGRLPFAVGGRVALVLCRRAERHCRDGQQRAQRQQQSPPQHLSGLYPLLSSSTRNLPSLSRHAVNTCDPRDSRVQAYSCQRSPKS